MNRRRGFTLLEVLLVLSLLALAAAMTFPVIRYVQKQLVRISTQSAHLEEIRSAQYWLRQQLANAAPKAMAVDSVTGRDIIWRGSGQHLEFMAQLPSYMASGQFALQKLYTEPSKNGFQLLYRVQLEIASESTDSSEPVQVLLSELSQVEFSYRSFISPGQPGPWQTEWIDQTIMPVQIRIKLWGAKKQALPEMIIALQQSPGLNTPAYALGTTQ